MDISNNSNSQKRVRGAARTTREDWVAAGLETLITEGVDSVKVAALAERLNCARSSFYWYFKDRSALLDALLDHWQELNTHSIVSRAGRAAQTINLALVNVFECWTSDTIFDTRLDFAVREWARRDEAVRRAVGISDDARLDALAGMFLRFGFEPGEAAVRARVVYFTQIGYEALDTRRTRKDRAETGPHYLLCMTGQPPTESELKALRALL